MKKINVYLSVIFIIAFSTRFSLAGFVDEQRTPEQRVTQIIKELSKYSIATQLTPEEWSVAVLTGSFNVVQARCRLLAVGPERQPTDIVLSKEDFFWAGQFDGPPYSSRLAVALMVRGLLALDGDDCIVAKALFKGAKSR